MSRGLRLGFLALAAGLAIGGSADAKVRYAAPDGNGAAGKCKLKNPCDLQDAVEHSSVADGDEVVVLPGTYSLANTLEIADAIEVHGEVHRKRPHLVGDFGGGSTVEVEVFAGAAEVHHLRLTKEAGGAINAGSGHVHDISAQGGELSEAIVYGQDALGSSNGVVIERVVARGPSATACIPPVAPGILRDSVCHAAGTGGFGVEIYPSQGGDYEIRNVTAIGPAGGILARAEDNEVVNLDARNVITDGIGIDVEAREIGVPAEVEIELSSSNYAMENEVNGATITNPGTGTNQTDPYLLVDPAGGNYVQLPASPTRNAGGGDMLGQFDFQRQLRVQQGAPDIGADEFDTGLKLKVKARKNQDGPNVKVKVKCPQEDCDVKAKGKVKAGGDSAKLKPATAFISAGQGARLKLKPKNRRDLAALLATGDAKAKIKVGGEDGGGSTARKRKTVRLTG